MLLATSGAAGPALADDGDDGADAGVEDVAADDEVDSDGGITPERPERADLTIEGLALTHQELESVPFTKAGANPPTPFVPFTSDELDGTGWAGGMRGTLTGTILDQDVQLSAFYLQPISLEQSKFDLGEGANPANTDAIYYDPAQNSTNAENIFGMVVHHETKLMGGEANILRPFDIPGLFVGARGIYFGEQLGVTTIEQSVGVPGGSDNTPDRDQVGVRVDNQLIGLQAGLTGMVDVIDGVRVGGDVKAGLFYNHATRRRTYQQKQTPDELNFKSKDSDDVLAQGIEINPRIEFRLADGVTLSAAGTFLYLNNVSESLPHLATVTDPDDASPRADGDTYFYGGSLGLTMELDGASKTGESILPIAPDSPDATRTEVEERLAAIEAMEARRGNRALSLSISGHINRMLIAWDDGDKTDIYEADNVSSRSRIEFEGAAKITRGLSAGYRLAVGLDDTASVDLDQTRDDGNGLLELRHAAWWLRHNKAGSVTVGFTSPATDDIILKDVGGIMPGAANISTMAGSFIIRHADEYEQDDDAPTAANNPLITRTTISDFAAGAAVDTLRRNVVRYDAPRWTGTFGSVGLATAWGEDDFWDIAAEYRIDFNDWKFRFGAGYLNDKDEGGRLLDNGDPARRDRSEYKGSASLLHIPTGLFATVAYVHRTFNGLDSSDQAVFGENTTGLVTPPGTNRPPTDYLFTAFGVRKRFSWIGDTTVYGEFARVDDAITGLREAGLDDATNSEVTDSRMEMIGAAISQNIDAAAMDIYLGFRHFTFDVEGAREVQGDVFPNMAETLTDISIAYTGARIKF
ncbi:MAG: hypothetical protein AB7S70_10990 [Hyphomicrobium sp.]|uniref:hypothetical protein n=1 Tax=Hyphomicrobium sp. TaxID=82 RepID=UPI003D0BC7EF